MNGSLPGKPKKRKLPSDKSASKKFKFDDEICDEENENSVSDTGDENTASDTDDENAPSDEDDDMVEMGKCYCFALIHTMSYFATNHSM